MTTDDASCAAGETGSRPEPLSKRWLRRALTIPGYVMLGGVTIALLPILLVAALLFDVVAGRRLSAVRCVLALALYVCCEAVGLLASFALWLGSGVWAGSDRERFVNWNYRLQNLWARALFGGARRIFSMPLHVEGADQVGDGPLFVFIRHASIVDTVLPAVVLEHPTGFRLRYVMKRELLWDPCLDIVGQRTRHVFVRRGAPDRETEIDAVRRLATDLGPREGVLLYPEGTRATTEKRKRVLERLAQTGDVRRLEAARRLRHTLPPRLGGAAALLAQRPDVDVLFFAHAGFDGVEALQHLWNGTLVGREIRVKMWRVAAAEIPKTHAERAAWLDREWAGVDAWVGGRIESERETDLEASVAADPVKSVK